MTGGQQCGVAGDSLSNFIGGEGLQCGVTMDSLSTFMEGKATLRRHQGFIEQLYRGKGNSTASPGIH